MVIGRWFVVEKADGDYLKMIIVPDGRYRSSFVLYYKGDFFWGEYGKKLGDLSGGHPGGSVVSSQDVVIPF